MSDAVLGNTFNLLASAWTSVAREGKVRYIVKREGETAISDTVALLTPYKFDIKCMSPLVNADIGSAKTAHSQLWPALRDMSMYSLHIEEDTIREPHWYPETAEMAYVHGSQAQMSIAEPDGSVGTYTIKPGDTHFIPRTYPHQIEM